MRNTHFVLNLLLLIFLLKNYLLVHAKEALATLWDVEDEDLLNFLAIEENLITVDNTLQPLLKNYDSSFGGTYIDVKENKVFINTLNFSLADEIKNLIGKDNPEFIDRMKFIQAPKNKSMTMISPLFQTIADLVNKYKPVDIQCYIDIKLNNVVIRSEQSDRDINYSFLSDASKYDPEIIYLTEPSDTHSFSKHKRATSIERKSLDGDGIYGPHGMCSIGFWARDKENANLNYFVTAGHCGNKGSKFWFTAWNSFEIKYFVGTMESITNKGTYDFNIINITGVDAGQTTSIRNTDSDHFKELFIVDIRVISNYGGHLCKTGYTTHVTCGFIKGLNAITTNTDRVIRTDSILAGKDNFITCKKGDSGGASFSYLQDLNLNKVSIVGITSSSFYDLNEYVPVNIILSKTGLELVTAAF